jgi:hypothetical protein
MAKDKLAIWTVLMASPTAAFALESDPGGAIVYSFVGGAAGGFLGALLACWLCCRRRAKDDAAVKKY